MHTPLASSSQGGRHHNSRSRNRRSNHSAQSSANIAKYPIFSNPLWRCNRKPARLVVGARDPPEGMSRSCQAHRAPAIQTYDVAPCTVRRGYHSARHFRMRRGGTRAWRPQSADRNPSGPRPPSDQAPKSALRRVRQAAYSHAHRRGPSLGRSGGFTNGGAHGPGSGDEARKSG
jgi:hypothetical protein